MKPRISFVWLASLALAVSPTSALAAFHLMEIDQVIGGVAGDTTAQAVQLQMRNAGQNFLSGNAQLVAHDATGANPVMLSVFPMPNPSASGTCASILLTTASFAAKTSPPLGPNGATGANYTMTAIPSSYLPGGSLTFETPGGGTVLWRLSWGTYTGPATVAPTSAGFNDDDGTAGSPATGALPSSGVKSLAFTPACGATSTTNVSQYAQSAGAAVFTNNAAATFTVQAPPAVPGLPGASHWLLPVALGAGVLGFALVRRVRARA
ncbi:MAG TPA: hypothetical protein VMR31_03655 [Myxococcota bacterium]|nr:hypothetical protein [Myxococcota bacterium]